MSTKPKKDNTKSTSVRFDQVTMNQIDWVAQFTKHLSVPGVTQRMVIARAIQFYTEYLEELLITFQCQPRHSDVIAEQKALIEAGEARGSAFSDGELPEVFAESGRLLGYKDLVKGAQSQKKPKLPGLRMNRQQRESVNLILKERSQQESQQSEGGQ